MKIKNIIIITAFVFFLSSCSYQEKPEEEGIQAVVDNQEDTELTIQNLEVIETMESTVDTEDYGSLGALQYTVFTIEEMLHYVLQDEYTARAEYEYIMSIYGVQNPFENIMKSEEQHISLLIPLYETYGIDLIEDTSDEHLFDFTTLTETYEIGVIAEVNNIAMYNLFLENQDLPNDIRDVFIKLRDASINHLAAFEKQVEKTR